MSDWAIKCLACAQVFPIPTPEEPAPGMIRLGVAIPQHPKPDEPEEMCEGSADIVDPLRVDRDQG